MLSVDIDIKKDHDIQDPNVKQALETITKYTYNKLSDLCNGKLISLFSGNGSYIQLNPLFGYIKPGLSDDEKVIGFESLTRAFNNYLFNIETDFYNEYPQYRDMVELDRINNRNRQIKAPLSIHKSFDYIVYPIPESFEIPLIKYQNVNDKQLLEAKKILKSFKEDNPNENERKQFRKILNSYLIEAKKEIKDKQDYKGNKPEAPENAYDIDLITSERVLKAIFDDKEWEDGNIKRITLMASYMGASGWELPDVKKWIGNHIKDWNRIPNDLNRRIEYGFKMGPPGIDTLYKRDNGFPSIGLKDFSNHLPEKPNGYLNPMTVVHSEHDERVKKEISEQQEKDLEIEITELKRLGHETLKGFDGDASNRLIKKFDRLHPGNGTNIFLGWLACLSSVMGTPLIVIVKGDPGTGKTQITDIIKDSIHKRHIIKLNNATESSLFGRGNIEGCNYPDKKIFYLGDLGDKNAMTNTAPYRKHIRELTSDGETTRELSDTNKPKDGDRPVLSETLTGYPTMVYSTVRDGEIEQQETDRAIEINPDLTKIKEIKKIILFYEDPTAKITMELTGLKNEWYPKFHGIFEYLVSSPQKVLLPWDLTNEEYGLRDTKTVASITRKLAMINQHSRVKIKDYIIASPVDLVLALRYVQDGGLERTRLQQIYDKYGLTKSFTRDDVVAMFPDSYSGLQAPKVAHRYILKPAIDDKDHEDTPVLEEQREYKPYIYYFRREPSNEMDFTVPEIDYSLLEHEYPDLPWKQFHESNTNKHNS
jgi:hypothetical protein